MCGCAQIVFNNPGFTFPGEKADYDGCRATIVLAILGLFGALSVEVLAFIHRLKARPALVISVAVTALAGTESCLVLPFPTDGFCLTEAQLGGCTW